MTELFTPPRNSPLSEPIPVVSMAPPGVPAARSHAATRSQATHRQLSRRPQPRTLTVRDWLQWILVCLCALSVWITLYALFFSGLQQAHDQSQLFTTLRQQLAGETAPVGGAIPEGAPVALLDVPSAGLHDEVVVEGTSSADLQRAPGHRLGTVFPGEAGTSVIYGKAVTFGGPFGGLQRVQPGDTVAVTTGEGRFSYAVLDVRSTGDPIPAATPADAGRLELVTTSGQGWRSGWAPAGLLIVDAQLGTAANPDQPVGYAKLDNQPAMAGDSAAALPLVLWLEAVAAASLLVTTTRYRWGSWQSYLVGGPVLVAMLWGATETAARLLPNLM